MILLRMGHWEVDDAVLFTTSQTPQLFQRRAGTPIYIDWRDLIPPDRFWKVSQSWPHSYPPQHQICSWPVSRKPSVPKQATAWNVVWKMSTVQRSHVYTPGGVPTTWREWREYTQSARTDDVRNGVKMLELTLGSRCQGKKTTQWAHAVDKSNVTSDSASEEAAQQSDQGWNCGSLSKRGGGMGGGGDIP